MLLYQASIDHVDRDQLIQLGDELADIETQAEGKYPIRQFSLFERAKPDESPTGAIDLWIAFEDSLTASQFLQLEQEIAEVLERSPVITDTRSRRPRKVQKLTRL
jgi:predicted nucleotidyltransferase